MSQVSERLLEELGETRTCDLSNARFLDPMWYHDPDLYALEIEEVFRKEWICVAREDQLREVGDYLTEELVGEPLLLVRTDEDTITTYSNVCRHRYYPVAAGAGNARVFTCAYHRWTYGLDGVLRGAPGMGGTDFEIRKCRLPKIRTECWNGFVFVNLDAAAAPLTPQIVGATEGLAPYELSTWSTTAIHDEIWPGNWKLVVENGMESLHHPGLHPVSVQPEIPGLGVKDISDFETWAHLKVPFTDEAARRLAEQTPEAVSRLDEADATALCGYFIYPSFILPIFPAYANWLSIMPVSASQARVFTGLAMSEEILERMGSDREASAAQSREQLVQVNQEDIQATRDLQRTTLSRFIDRGPVTPLELSVLNFHRYLANRLVSER